MAAAQTKITEPNIVNGINVDDLFALIDGVKRDVAKVKQTGGLPRPGRVRRGAVPKSRVLRSAENVYRAGSRLTSTNPTSWAARTVSLIRRNIC